MSTSNPSNPLATRRTDRLGMTLGAVGTVAALICGLAWPTESHARTDAARSAAHAQRGQLRLDWRGRCATASGASVRRRSCGGGAAQTWRLPVAGAAGPVEVDIGAAIRCVTVGGAVETPVSLAACTGASNQVWTLTDERALVNPATGWVLAARGSTLHARGAALSGSVAGRWTVLSPEMDPPSPHPERWLGRIANAELGTLVLDWRGRCATARGGTAVRASCRNLPTQQWRVPRPESTGPLEVHVGGQARCIEARGLELPVRVTSCTDEDDQLWTRTAERALVNVETGLPLAAHGGGLRTRGTSLTRSVAGRWTVDPVAGAAPRSLHPARWRAAVDDHPAIANVRSALDAVAAEGTPLAFRDTDLFPDAPRDYSQGLDRIRAGHFQGVQRIEGTNMIALTGSATHAGHLFIVELGSRPESGDLGTNVFTDQKPPSTDRVVHVQEISTTLHHAGGFQILGDVAAIPLEQSGHDAVVQFWNLETPTRPVLLSTLTGLESREAGAAGLAVTDDDDYLLVVGRADSQVLDFYTSQSDLAEADFTHAATWRSSNGLAAGSVDRNFGNYQTLNLLRQEDGTMYLLGFHRSGAAGGEVGQDWVDLFTVTLSGSSVSLKKVAKRHMTATRGHFQKGAGVYVRADGSLAIYAVPNGRAHGRVEFDEFGRARPTTTSSVNDRWLQLYDDRGYTDRAYVFDREREAQHRYDRNALHTVHGFNDKMSSYRYLAPTGWGYRLYEDRDGKGRSLLLAGTGRQVSSNVPDGWNDKVSSFEFEQTVITGGGYVHVYEHDDFKGRRVVLQPGQAVRDYKRAPGGKFGDTVSSVRFQLPAGTTYTLYEHDRYRGKRLVLRGTGRVVEIRDLGARGYRFEDKVSSSK